MNNMIVKVIEEYFEIVTPLLQYKMTSEIKRYNELIMEYVVNVYSSKDSKDKCLQLVENAYCIEKSGDATILNLDSYNDELLKKTLEIKANIILNECDIKNNLRIFDIESFKLELYNKALQGDKKYCKLYAVMNYLGIGYDKNLESSVLMFKMLSYMGDEFSMKSLVYINSLLNNNSEKEKWGKSLELLLEMRNNFLLVIKNKELYSTDVVETVEKIMSSIIRYNNRNKLQLEIPMLYYIATTNDQHIVVINNICNMDADGYILSLREKKFETKKYGF